jgi:hypothetical protein
MMRKSTIALAAAAGGVLLTLLVSVISSSSSSSMASDAASYGEDRALIENLQARYLFALDFHDPDLYVSTFTPDGILDYGTGEVRGREAIREVIAGMPGNSPAPVDDGLRPAAGRHHISNIVLKIDGDRATGRAYWFHTGNDNPERRTTIGGFGHYEDEIVRVNGEWLFAKRTIYNEGVLEWAAPGANPAW